MRARQGTWRCFETLGIKIQLQMLQAAAVAIELLENSALKPIGEQATLFLPEPEADFANGAPDQNSAAVDQLAKSVEEAIAKARFSPDTARVLFAIAARGCKNSDSLERIRRDFDDWGIPREYLPHNVPEYPFAELRLNDGFSD
ncbi:hypothetical protein [Sphingomonas sp. OTU376]|uniref:hypothetical protein n=1 Tax=Sphingomonas sp. OTU376 TaxID=3043863 RepID=UPI00313ECA31